MEDSVGGHTRRGHLQLDATGAVEAEPTGPDGRPVDEEILDGPQGPTWHERLDSTGAPAFARRHRGALRRAAVLLGSAALIASVVGAAYLIARPAVDDGTVRATVRDGGPVRTYDPPVDIGGVLRFPYAVTPDRPGDVVRVLGLVGPGVRASTSAGSVGTAPGEPAVADVLVIPACDIRELANAVWSDYRIRVERTDATGSTVTALLEVPAGSKAQWPADLGAFCSRQLLATGITAQRVEVAPAVGAQLNLEVSLRNELAVDVVATHGRTGGAGWSLPVPVDLATLVHGTTTVLGVSLPVVDCGTTPLDEVPTVDGTGTVSGLLLDATLVTGDDQGPGTPAWSPVIPTPWSGTVPVRFSPREIERISTALAPVCAQAPPVTLRTVRVTRAGADEVPVWLENEAPLPVRALAVRLEVRSTAERIEVSDGRDEFGSFGSSSWMLPTTATLRAGRATITVVWMTRCVRPDEPPWLQLSLSAGGRAYPRRVQLADPAFTAGYLDLCQNLSTAALLELGWPARG